MNALLTLGLFDTSDFPARWDCGTWTALHGWTHILSDIAIFGAYAAIPLSIGYFLRKRPDVHLPSLWWLFAAFIFSCGFGHLVESTIFWYPWYRLSALAKVVTAVVSWGTVLAIWLSLPTLVRLPGAVRLNDQLLHEIASKRKTAESLQRSEARFRAVVDTALDAVILTDRSGQVTEWNLQAETVFGRPKSEVLQKRWWELLIPEASRKEYADLHQRLVQAHEKDQGQRVEVLAQHRNGHLFPVEMSIAAFQTGEETACSFFARDITQQKKAKRELSKKSRELARSNEDLENFAYAVSHDLQQPLRAISGFTQILHDKHAERLDDTAKKQLTRIVGFANRMKAMIDGILDLSRLGSGQMEVREIPLSEVIGTVTQSLEPIIADRGAEITIDELPKIVGDPTLLNSLFQNLIENAIKFGGSPPIIKVDAQCTDTEWVIRVTDNGIGLESQQAQRIFTIFQRLHSETEFPGLGLGLAMCKKIVERHNGRIWVDSEPNAGATFLVAFKREPDHQR